MPSEPDVRPAHVVLLGNPASRRVAAFREAARRVGGLTINVVSYPDFLQGRTGAPPAGGIVRIESPGECATTTKEILKAGIAPLEEQRRVPIGDKEINELAFGRGEVLHPLQWYLGYERILSRLANEWNVPGVRWMATPAAIATCFDKLACLQRWSNAGLPVPRRYDGLAMYAELRRTIQERHARVFVKLRYGYSAMGAVALEWRGPLVRAITTVDVVRSHGRPRLFVTKRPRLLNREFEIAWLIDTLGMEGIIVEKWLTKLRHNGQPFDLRIVTIEGRVQHVVGRASSSPFTNLNLDARRIGRDVVQEHLGPAWTNVVSLSERAAGLLPNAGTLGIDLIVRPCRESFALLEANAFGDYLPGLTFNGRSTYEAALCSQLTPERASV